MSLTAVDSRPEAPILHPRPQLPATAAGLQRAVIETRFELRFNIRAHHAELRVGADTWQGLHDRLEARLRERIAETCDEEPDDATKTPERLFFSRERWRHALNALLAEQEVDPFKDWLQSLPRWDGSPRIDTWIQTCFHLAPGLPSSLCSWAARSILLAAVWRTYRPGTKHDTMMVLVGPQGIGKSTAFAWLLPRPIEPYGLPTRSASRRATSRRPRRSRGASWWNAAK